MTEVNSTYAQAGWQDAHAEDALFDYEVPPPISLSDKFGVPPMSVLDRRSGEWQDRKRRWLTLGIKSELGRAASALPIRPDGPENYFAYKMRGLNPDGVSVFDPVICELAYRWHTNPGDRVLDPFAGGSVRGVVASTLARYYVGMDLRAEQVEANEAQLRLCSDIRPSWIQGDSQRLHEALDPGDEFDMVFSCPPYGDLERYSENPRDLSTMSADEFNAAHREIVGQACERLRGDRFAAWVISDVRDRRGAYRGLVADSIAHFRSAGMHFHNDAVLLDPIGTGAVRAETPFRATRKLVRVHQHMLVFVKGSAKAAAARLEGAPADATPAARAPDLCGYWSGGRYCGVPGRLYASGWYCDPHSPAAMAGRAHPDSLRVS